MRATREVFLTFGALLGVLCILATIAGAAFDVKPLVFRSGSMSPAIHTGDLGVSRTVDASSLERGDIVSVVNSGGNRVTHRLVSAAAQGDARQLTLRGDANKSPDAEIYTVTSAEKVLFDVPKAGYAVDAATSPVGLFLLGLYVAGMLALVFRRRPSNGPEDRALVLPPGGSRKVSRSKRSRAAFRTIMALGAAVSLTVGSAASAAPWTDPVVISGTTFSAYAVPPPVVTCATLGIGRGVRLNWTAIAGATGYVLHYGANGSSTTTVGGDVTSKTISGLLTSGTFTAEAQINYGSTTWTSATSNSNSYTVVLFAVSLCG